MSYNNHTSFDGHNSMDWKRLICIDTLTHCRHKMYSEGSFHVVVSSLFTFNELSAAVFYGSWTSSLVSVCSSISSRCLDWPLRPLWVVVRYRDLDERREGKRIQSFSWHYRPDWTSVFSFSLKKSSKTPGCSRRTEIFGYLQHPLVGLVVSVKTTTVPLKTNTSTVVIMDWIGTSQEFLSGFNFRFLVTEILSTINPGWPIRAKEKQEYFSIENENVTVAVAMLKGRYNDDADFPTGLNLHLLHVTSVPILICDNRFTELSKTSLDKHERCVRFDVKNEFDATMTHQCAAWFGWCLRRCTFPNRQHVLWEA